MEVAASSINSRATAIKTILLAAWRNKLVQEEWADKIKKVLPRGVNGDVYDLADCLLKQALVGPVPNQLFMTYLEYAVQCELISHSAVLSSIANLPIYNKLSNSTTIRTTPIICLAEFLKTFRDKISCEGTEIECLNLCHSLSQLVHWLIKCVDHSIDSLIELNQQQQQSSQQHQNPPQQQQQPLQPQQLQPNQQQLHPSQLLHSGSNTNLLPQQEPLLKLIELCNETIHYFINKPFTKSLIFISKIEHSDNFNEMVNLVQRIQQKIVNFPNIHSVLDEMQNFDTLQRFDMTFNSYEMHPTVVAAAQLRNVQTHRIRSTNQANNSTSGLETKSQQNSIPVHDSTTNYALFNSLYPLIAFDVVLRPARSHRLLARQIATITNFNSAPIYITYCELIRVCMIGIIDTEGTPAKVKWAFFTFLKMPKLLIELSKVFKLLQDKQQTFNSSTLTISLNVNQSNTSEFNSPSHVADFVNDLKLAFERLCEYSPLLDEAEYKCNCDLFKCLVKELIKNEPNLIQLKNVDFRNFASRRPVPNNNDSSVGGHMMLKTEPVVTSMLETFDSEQDPYELYAILSQLVSGKHFEFTLSAAASTGRLHMFVKKLVEHNEINGVPQQRNPANIESQSRNTSQIQALIFDITFLILTYIAQQYGPLVIGLGQRSTFNKWFYTSYNPATRINCPKEMLKNSNDSTVTSLIKQILAPDNGIQMKSINWLEVCLNMPKALSEILEAWNQGYLDDNDIKNAIERIKSKMCFLAVVAATWLQCYIKTLNESEKAKPIYFLQCLTKASSQAKQQKQQFSSETGLKSESYSERSSLMCSIIRKIYFELVPKVNGSISCNVSNSTSGANPATTAVISNSVISNNLTSNVNTLNESEEMASESAHQSINDRFLSTLTTHELCIANVKQCLNRGWIDHKSLSSLSSLFKMIGSESFTNLMVDQILTSHESPTDLSRAVNITFGLFHLDIEACAFALLKDTIPAWLISERKQTLLNQPRAFALAHLAVMTVVEVLSNLETIKSGGSGQSKSISNNSIEDSRLNLNGIVKQEPGINSNGPNRDAKRVKLMQEPNFDGERDTQSDDLNEGRNRLNECVSDLMRLFKEIMADPVMSQRSLFPILFLQQTIICTREESSAITLHLQPEILLDMINLFSSELTFESVLAMSNLSTSSSRKFAAKAMCKLALIGESSKPN